MNYSFSLLFLFTSLFLKPLHAVEFFKLNFPDPPSHVYYVERSEENAPPITFYYSPTKGNSFPITIFCDGSHHRNLLYSVVCIHRHLVSDFLPLGTAFLTVDQWGTDGDYPDANTYMKHYTVSQRLKDHKAVIDHLIEHPPEGWNGKLIFVGLSEGVRVATRLTEDYNPYVLATMNWCGPIGSNWREDLWDHLTPVHQVPWSHQPFDFLAYHFLKPFNLNKQYSFSRYNEGMDKALENPTSEKEFLGLTHKYHADLMLWQAPNYDAIKTPLFFVMGCLDPYIHSADVFVEKALEHGIDITYLRVEDMHHYILQRPDVLQKSFDWLEAVMDQDTNDS